MRQDFYNQLCNIAGSCQVLTDEPLKKHTTFRIGGPADFYVLPKTGEAITEIVKACNKFQKPYYILGNGSNLLVSDQGYRGTIIQIFKNFNSIEIIDTKLRVKVGAMLSKVSSVALEQGLTGLEFASGIPGTLGGAIVMNAGAYGGEMKDVIEEVKVATRQGELLTLKKDELEMGYRTSVIAKKDYIVLEATLSLKQGIKAEIRGKMDELKEKRVSKQPLEFPSAGSTFKRPSGYFAGELIMKAGLRGFSVGDAQVSEKHCGFVINKGSATASDVIGLMEEVKRRVWEQFQVQLEPEVKRLGEF